ncbi:MAG TPA: helix-turn-helix transcriptional regulator [Chlamydiales bacterium]|nr:helix-turn-helix transcriptional regulator [Chlamydiales bacterium]
MTDQYRLSTFDRSMQNSARREQFDEKYRGFVFVEVLISLLEKSKFSVRELAKNAQLSPTVIQDIKSGKKDSISFSTFRSILQALGQSINK